MCVPVWAREIDLRRSMSTSECASAPGTTSPSTTVARCVMIAADRGLDVAHLDDRAVVQLDPAAVGQLAAALRVERGAVEDQLDVVAGTGDLDLLAVADDAGHPALGDHLVVPGELDRAAETVGDPPVDRGVDVALTSCALASARARSFCSCMSRRNPASSTATPCSAAISRVRSMGNP